MSKKEKNNVNWDRTFIYQQEKHYNPKPRKVRTQLHHYQKLDVNTSFSSQGKVKVIFLPYYRNQITY